MIHREHVEERTLEEMTVGYTAKKKFFAAFLSGFLLLGMLGAVFGITGVAAAVPLAGIGHFTVEFDKLEGTSFKFFPKIGETGERDAAPMVRNVIDQATVYGLHIYKDIELPGGNTVRLHIKASEPVKIKGLIQDASKIKGNFQFHELALEENHTDGLKEFTQHATKLTITDAKILTNYLFQTLVTLQGTHIYLTDIEG